MTWKQSEPKGFFVNADAAAGEAKYKMEFGLGTVEIFDDRVGLLAPDHSKRDSWMEVPFESIAAISVRPPTLTMMGVLRISVHGVETGNGDSLYFFRGQRQLAQFTADAIGRAKAEYLGGKHRATADRQARSRADELLKLKSLLDSGVLSEDEFARLKGAVLDGSGSTETRIAPSTPPPEEVTPRVPGPGDCPYCGVAVSPTAWFCPSCHKQLRS